MATCKTCRGEYLPQQSLCPYCGSTLGRAERMCPNPECAESIVEWRLCPRCRSDLVSWEREQISFDRFFILGGFLGMAMPFVACVLWIFKWSLPFPAHAVHHPVASAVSIALPLLAFFGIFSVRYQLREKLWDAQVGDLAGPSIAVLTIGSILIGIGSLALAFVVYKMGGQTPDALSKLIFNGLYVLGFFLLTAGLTLFVTLAHVQQLDESVPQPVYADTNQLLDIVLQATEDILPVPDLPNSPVRRYFEVTALTRTADRGIRVFTREDRFIQRAGMPPGPGSERPMRPRFWRIDADKWGRIRSLQADIAP